MIANPEKLIDVKGLRASLRAMLGKHGATSPAFRPAVVQHLKEILQSARAEAEARLLRDGSGTACAENLSHVEDEIIRALFDLASGTLFPARPSGSSDAGQRHRIRVGCGIASAIHRGDCNYALTVRW